MKSKLDSKGLFVYQMKQHMGALTELLAGGLDGTTAPNLVEKCILSTNMLAGSTSLIGLDGWRDCLSAYESLLLRNRNEGCWWDERVAQVTSELIEKEEVLVSAYESSDDCDLDSVVTHEERLALLEEITVILDAETVQAHPAEEGLLEAEGVQHAKAPSEKVIRREEDSHAASKMDTLQQEAQEDPLVGVSPSLKSAFSRLCEAMAHTSGATEGRSISEFREIRKQLCLIDFFARSLDETLREHAGGEQPPVTSSLEPVQVALESFGQVLSGGTNRRVDIIFKGGEIEVDARLLFYAEQVLRRMIQDVLLRCDEVDLQIEIEAAEKRCALWWGMRDNGENFITDSRLDQDEFLAFYPSLIEVRRILGQLNSLLWVEPDENHNTRFAFTMPLSKDQEKFMVWGLGEESFGILSTQLCDVLSRDAIPVESDSRGEHLVIDQQSVPLARLELVSADAPREGDRIVIIGALEKRIAFHVEGEGRLEEGVWLEDAISMWKGISRGVAQIGERRIPLIEAASLLDRYLGSSGEMDTSDGSGGVAQSETDLSQSQATFEKDTMTPPETHSEEGEVDVLVVERSQALRKAFASVLSSEPIRSKIVENADDAVEFIKNHSPRLIVAEFRMPTMAAKVVVEALQQEEKSIPVLVTTSHTGETADLLVKKLGVSGFLSKPLDPAEFMVKVADYVQQRGACPEPDGEGGDLG